MDGHTFLSWNIVNFVTVLLMALVGLALYKTGLSVWQNYQGQGAN